jgi:putative ABC transport system ATP-binding protein
MTAPHTSMNTIYPSDPDHPVSDRAGHLEPTGSDRPVGFLLALEAVAHSISEAGQERQTLAPLSRRFAPGRFHVVGGPSGAGKTTLLSLLSTAVRPTRGLIRWGEEVLTGYAPDRLAQWRRNHLGLIFQTSRLVSVMSVRDHVTLAAAIRNKPAAAAHGMAILDALGMGGQQDKLPAQLSGGEKQRVAIAQALCARPAVLLADEPTAALDQSNAMLVAHSLRTFARERNAVVICVSHDRVVMDAADELLMLEKA